MRFASALGTLGLALAVGATTLTWTQEAEACGGCFVPPRDVTQVTGHRMVLTVSKDQSTLYDQIEYDGDPESFGWVLPIRGTVDVGVSSDLIFNLLDQWSGVRVSPPPIVCPPNNCANGSDSLGSSSATSGTGGGSGGGVSVIAQATVGPYETVQLSATDTGALDAWFDTHGYQVPDEVLPVVSAYLAEDFNFLAIKLIPGVGTNKMAPIRVTTPGASAVLPLRMVAAGTGAITPMTLWVVGEGRYEPANFPSFEIDEAGLIWDWDENRSNYTDLRQQAYDASNGHAWLTEVSTNLNPTGFRNSITSSIEFGTPGDSGYADNTTDELTAANEDLDVLFQGINGPDLRVTRLRAELTRDALAGDLLLQAASDQGAIDGFFQVADQNTIGTPPACPPPPDCGPSGGNDGDGWTAPWTGSGQTSGGGDGCAIGQSRSLDTMLAGGWLLALMAMRRRRRKRR